MLLSGCANDAPQESESMLPMSRQDIVSVGLGNNTFTLQVIDDKGEVAEFEVNTDQITVGAALIEAGLVDGDTGDFGLMVTHVNGQRADYAEDGAFWAFHIDGEFAMTGVDMAVIEQGKIYALIYTEA